MFAGEFCKNVYRTIANTDMGSVIWTYIKPIMSGKILFTPDTPLTQQIIKEVGISFSKFNLKIDILKK